MYSLIFKLILKYYPYSRFLMLPVTVLIGFIGYKVEGFVSDRYTPPLKNIEDERSERLLKEEIDAESLKTHKFVPKTIFEKNLSPSLKKPDPRLQQENRS